MNEQNWTYREQYSEEALEQAYKYNELDMLRTDLVKFLTRCRKALGITQVIMAARWGISSASISAFEQGKSDNMKYFIVYAELIPNDLLHEFIDCITCKNKKRKQEFLHTLEERAVK